MENQPQVPVTEQDADVTVVDTYDTEAVKKALETTAAQKKHWREKAKQFSEEKAALTKQLEEFNKQKAEASQKNLQTEKPQEPLFDTLADNLAVLRNLEDDEVNELRGVAKELGTDPIKYIKSKAGQAHLKEYRAGKKSNEATPTPSNRVPVFNGKPVNDILKSDATPAEKQAAWEAKMRTRGINTSI